MMKKKKLGNTKLLIIAVVMTFVVMFGTTYAWLRLTKTSTIENKITAGNLELVLDDTTSEGITLVNEVPKSYRQGMETKEYTFTLTSKNSTSSYSLSLKDLAKYTNDENEEVTVADENRLEDSKIRYILLKDGEEADVLRSKILTDRTIDTGTIEKNQTITYSLRVWIDSKVETEVMGKVFNAQLNIEATQYVQPTKTTLCRRATTLHTEICSNKDTSQYCLADGYTDGLEITYGNLGTKGVLTSGDAFDCDVNGDGVYDSETERFYYVSDMTNGVTVDSNIAVLIYYNNVIGGIASNSTGYAYDSNLDSYTNGPITALTQLPTIEQWKNTNLVNTTRDITDETGAVKKSGFSYSGYAARLLTYQEVYSGCYDQITTVTTNGGLSTKCKYLLENTRYSSSNLGTYGTWLETPSSSLSFRSWNVNGNTRRLFSSDINYSSIYGIRPVIEVAKTNIEY